MYNNSLPMKLRPFVKKNLHKIKWKYFSYNPNSIHMLSEDLSLESVTHSWEKLNLSDYLLSDIPENIDKNHYNVDLETLPEKNIDKARWDYLSKNSNAIHILKKNLHKVRWDFLSANTNAIDILEQNLDKVNWRALSKNPNAIHILEKNIDKIDWQTLSENPNAIHILENNITEIDWDALSCNPSAIHILEKNIDKINWDYLSSNINGICILENNIDKIHWFKLCRNPNAVTILENNLDKIDKIYWVDLIRENRKIMAEEIAKIVWHPSRIYKWPEDHLIYDSDDFLDYEDYKNTSTIRTIKMSIRHRS